MIENSPKGCRRVWSDPVLEKLAIDLSTVRTGNNYFIDGSKNNNLARKS